VPLVAPLSQQSGNEWPTAMQPVQVLVVAGDALASAPRPAQAASDGLCVAESYLRCAASQAGRAPSLEPSSGGAHRCFDRSPLSAGVFPRPLGLIACTGKEAPHVD